jgi:hypothetical protein
MTDLTIPKFTVIQYVRNKKRVPYGVLVAMKVGSGFICGYSLCNKKDFFNKKMALKIAIGRANTCSVVIEKALPHEVRKMLPAFFDRCKRYYKNGT